MNVRIKTPREIKKIRKACHLLAEIFREVEELVKPGVRTIEIEKKTRYLIYEAGAEPAFLNYPKNGLRYPAATCISINEVLVHGIPGERIIRKGDVVKIDMGLKKSGFYADMAKSFIVGEVEERIKELVKETYNVLLKVIENLPTFETVADIGKYIQKYIESKGFSVIREYTGHGIGRNLHEYPPVPNYYVKELENVKLKPGMVMAIEPMVSLGDWKTVELDDGWTVVMADGSCSAHWEHTVALLDGKAEVLTV